MICIDSRDLNVLEIPFPDQNFLPGLRKRHRFLFHCFLSVQSNATERSEGVNKEPSRCQKGKCPRKFSVLPFVSVLGQRIAFLPCLFCLFYRFGPCFQEMAFHSVSFLRILSREKRSPILLYAARKLMFILLFISTCVVFLADNLLSTADLSEYSRTLIHWAPQRYN